MILDNFSWTWFLRNMLNFAFQNLKCKLFPSEILSSSPIPTSCSSMTNEASTATIATSICNNPFKEEYGININIITSRFIEVYLFICRKWWYLQLQIYYCICGHCNLYYNFIIIFLNACKPSRKFYSNIECVSVFYSRQHVSIIVYYIKRLYTYN